MTYTKSEIRTGMYMELDAPFEAYIKRPPSPPDFSEASAALDQVRQRLEKLRADLTAARQRR